MRPLRGWTHCHHPLATPARNTAVTHWLWALILHRPGLVPRQPRAALWAQLAQGFTKAGPTKP